MFFWDQFVQKKGHYQLWATPKMKNNFFDRNDKSRSSAFRNILFYQNICFDWVMSLFLSWVQMFFVKVSFPATAVLWNCEGLLTKKFIRLYMQHFTLVNHCWFIRMLATVARCPQHTKIRRFCETSSIKVKRFSNMLFLFHKVSIPSKLSFLKTHCGAIL